ncbi:uncharacterized protein LOC144498975 [Mustelus asterias]
MDSNQSEEMQAVTLRELTKDRSTPRQSSGENVNVFCEDCQEYFVDGCVVHGAPVFVTDTPVEIDTPLRAFYTIPHGLAVGPSGNRDGGLGVWCTAKVIPKGVMFGPYEGQIAVEQDSTEKLYSQMVQERNFVKPGAFDESKCNWMRFVNLAKAPEETNLTLSQCSGKIYYKVCRSIEPAHELFIWHGEEAVNRPLDKSGEVTGKHGTICTYNRIEVAGAYSVQQKQGIKTEEEPHHGFTKSYCHDTVEEEQDCGKITQLQSHHNADQMKPPQEDSVNGVHPARGVCNPKNTWLENQCEGNKGETLPGGVLVISLEQLECTLPQDEPDTFEHLLKFGNYKAQSRQDGKNKRVLNPSSLICNKEKRFNCDNCERKFYRKEHLTMHRRTHVGEKPFACEECGRAFAEKWNLKEHRRTHTGVRPYSCRFCGKAFYRSSHLKVHLRRHTGEKPYKCENCHQTFVDSSSLQRHKRLPSVCCKPDCTALIHSVGMNPMEKQESGNCDRASTGNRQLNPSGKQVNGALPENGVCDLPKPQLENIEGTVPGDVLINGLEHLDSNRFQDKPDTFEHLLKVGNYKAQGRRDGKNKRTMNPSSLICNKEKRFNCDYCERKFYRKEHLTMHRRTHTGERPFACEECGRAFAEKWNLKEHRRTHTGVRPYSCRFCGKAFYRSSHLKVHLRRHTGEKPYKCENCHQTFVDSSSLQKHKRLPSVCCKPDCTALIHSVGVKPMEKQESGNCDRASTGNRQLNPSGKQVLANGVLLENGVCDLPKPRLENEGGTVPGDVLINGLERLDSNLFQDKPHTFEHLLKVGNYKAQGRLDGKNKRTMNPSSLICNKEKRFNCDYCERKFYRKEHLTMHRRTHTGEKPFACEECGRAFAEKWNLKEHRRTHTGVRPYSCRFCGKAFYRSSHLKVHLRRHTGEKPYKCENCHQTFVDSSSLQKHKRLPSACCKTDQIDSAAMHPIAPMTEQGQNCNTNTSGDLPFIQGNNMENIRQHRGCVRAEYVKSLRKEAMGDQECYPEANSSANVKIKWEENCVKVEGTDLCSLLNEQNPEKSLCDTKVLVHCNSTFTSDCSRSERKPTANIHFANSKGEKLEPFDYTLISESGRYVKNSPNTLFNERLLTPKVEGEEEPTTGTKYPVTICTTHAAHHL